MMFGLFRGHHSPLEIFIDQGVIVSDLVYFILAEEIGPAVPYMPDVSSFLIQEDRDKGGPHAREGRVLFSSFVDFVVRRLDGHFQASYGWGRISGLLILR